MRAFTTRGLSLLCAGAALLAGGLAIGQRDVVGLGVLVFAVPLLSLAALAGSPRRLAHSRTLQPERVTAGNDARVLIQVHNASPKRAVAGVLAEDTLPNLPHDAPRFDVGYLRPGATRDLSYRVRPPVRGGYPIGPLRLTIDDPLGCVRMRRTLGTHVPLLVTPPVVALPRMWPMGGAADSGESSSRFVTGVGEDDQVPRAYRHGDDLRRVHWRSTARVGKLMVRREEHRLGDHSAVLLDMRQGAHAGDGEDSSLETAVSAAASIGLHLIGRSQDVRLLTDEREVPGGRRETVLDALALTPASPAVRLGRGVDLVAGSPVAGTGLCVAILGALTDGDLAALARLGSAHSHRRVAVLCAAAAWPSPATLDTASDALARTGWLVYRIDTVEDLLDQGAPVHEGAGHAWGGAGR
ncbi:DUF58 domain-containing protein [Nocardiopsis gilva]|uniref:DUF58 domain-containing protein n=1 Tax=Nocardiopsis gilva TaxID=280236 RepID=UPI0003498556|nr:DUF58 domain-containing protein [Nocardiopsis gilva]